MSFINFASVVPAGKLKQSVLSGRQKQKFTQTNDSQMLSGFVSSGEIVSYNLNKDQ